MTLQHITFSPLLCECVIELQYEDTDNPPENKLWFFHKVCDKHLPLVQNKPKLKDTELKQKRDAISQHHQKLLENNRTRHLQNFDNAEERKQRKETIKLLVKDKDTEKHALKMDAVIQEERRKEQKALDDHEDNSMHRLLTGIYSPYAFISEAVYEKIQQENREANPFVENDIEN